MGPIAVLGELRDRVRVRVRVMVRVRVRVAVLGEFRDRVRVRVRVRVAILGELRDRGWAQAPYSRAPPWFPPGSGGQRSRPHIFR